MTSKKSLQGKTSVDILNTILDNILKDITEKRKDVTYVYKEFKNWTLEDFQEEINGIIEHSIADGIALQEKKQKEAVEGLMKDLIGSNCTEECLCDRCIVMAEFLIKIKKHFEVCFEDTKGLGNSVNNKVNEVNKSQSLNDKGGKKVRIKLEVI